MRLTTVRFEMATRAAIVLALLAGAGVAAAAPVITPEVAIRTAVHALFGADAAITIAALSTTVGAQEGLEATPDATARIGKPARFILTAGGTRRGLAIATVNVTVPHLRAARNIARDADIDAAAVTTEDAALPRSLPLARLPVADAVIGLKARRPIVAGEPLTAAILRVPPVVKSGDEVDATLHIGRVSVTGSGIASGSGQVGDIIRIRQPHSSRLLNARIVGPGAVEIVQ